MIREAKLDDLKHIVEIEKACFPILEAASCHSLKERISALKSCFYVYEKENQLVGFINGGVSHESTIQDMAYEDIGYHDENGPYQMVFGLDVLPQYQHLGIAKELMKTFIQSAIQRNKKAVVLTCKKELIGFYEQFGYINKGVSKSNHGNVIWYDMSLSLKKE